jgi:hypothetical protein
MLGVASEAVMADATKQRPAFRMHRRPDATSLRGSGFLLVFCCVASACLVLLSGLTIALMQFQARMLQADANFTSGDVVLYAELDKAMRSERANLDDLFVRTEMLNAQVIAAQDEIEYRVEHVCRSLNLAPERHQLCRIFLQTIPFNMGRTIRLDPGAMTAAVDGADMAVAAAPVVAGEEKLVAVLTASLGERIELGQGQVELLRLHAGSFEDIAGLNVKLRLETLNEYFRANGELMSRCMRIIQFAKAMDAYRSFNVRDCHNRIVYAEYAPSPFAPATMETASVRAAAPPLETSDAPTPPAAEASPAPDEPAGDDGDSTVAPGEELPTVFIGGTIEEPTPVADTDLAPGARQKNFELVSQYLFYDWLSFGLLNRLLITPNDFIAFTLVALSGVLGGLLKLIVGHSKTGKLDGWRSMITTLLLGLICALIVYALFRAGFLALTTQGSATGDSNISPFVIALLALGSGFVSDRAIAAFRNWIDAKLGESESDEIERWAFGLNGALDELQLGSDALAVRLAVDPQLVEAWRTEKAPVPGDYQDRITLLLDRSRRELFTIDPPLQAQGG